MGNTGAVRALLVARANPNVCNARSRSPLEDAVECSHAEIVQLLIAADADIFKLCTDMTPTVKKEMMRDSILKQLSLTTEEFKLDIYCLRQILSSRSEVLISAAAKGLGDSTELLDRLSVKDLVAFLRAPGQTPVCILDAIFQEYPLKFWHCHGKMQRKSLRVAHVDTYDGITFSAGPHQKVLQQSFVTRECLAEKFGPLRWQRFIGPLTPRTSRSMMSSTHQMLVPVKFYMCHLPLVHKNLAVLQAITDCRNRSIFAHWGCRAIVKMHWKPLKRNLYLRMTMSLIDLICMSFFSFPGATDTSWRISMIAVLVMWVLEAFFEILQLLGYCWNGLGGRYLRSTRLWYNLANLLFGGSTVLAATVTGLPIREDPAFRIMLGLLAFLKWNHLIQQIRVIRVVGVRVLPMAKTLLMVFPFYGILFLYICAAAHTFHALGINPDNFFYTFNALYYVSVLGEVEKYEEPPPYRDFLLLLVGASSFFIGIVLMNLFVAVLTTRYFQAAQCAEQDLMHHRASCVLEQYAMQLGRARIFCPRRAIADSNHRKSMEHRSNFQTSNNSLAWHDSDEASDAYVWVGRADRPKDASENARQLYATQL